MKRPDYEIALIDRVLPILTGLMEPLAGTDAEMSIGLINSLTDHQALAALCNLFARELYEATPGYGKGPQVCGWCVMAGGDTQEAADAAERFDLEGVRAHGRQCTNNPIVQEVERLRAALTAACEVADGWIGNGGDEEAEAEARATLARLQTS